MKTELPLPSPDAQAASVQLSQLICAEITRNNGWISFARYWEMALYTPGLGYYAGGLQKFGNGDGGGDFITAPELTPLFGQTLARQVAQVMALSGPTVVEAGAGTGKLAADMLAELDKLGCAPDNYFILELSGELRARQRDTIAAAVPHLLARVSWLDALPERICGCVVGNEVLDAMPVTLLAWTENGVQERGVALNADNHFSLQNRPASDYLKSVAAELPIANDGLFHSEIGLAGRAWAAEWGKRLEQGAVILLDYGLPRHEYYHPQRDGGTVRCHYRHRAHNEVFWWPGLSDITAHVDFTAIAEAAFGAGLDVLGYTSQANFLMNCGIAELLQGRQDDAVNNPVSAVRAGGATNILLSPNEMGELFKVIALGKGIAQPLTGFQRGDRTHTL